MTIPDIIRDIEQTPNAVISKAYILNRLRESQRHETGLSAQLEQEFESVLKTAHRKPDDG